ncbi:NAD(P)-dependent oxidoreductase [Ahniella affigens]|nr:NAD(P)-dependent oxidoreductase [Ahniella affigens]
MTVGFIGIGRMGEPIARRLLQSGQPLVVWSRTPHHADTLRADGGIVASSSEALLGTCETVLLMLRDEAAIDAVLARGSKTFARLTRDHCIVQMGTVDPLWSQRFGEDLTAAGARYVEAPVSGSKIPAERGTLLGMLAGAESDLERIEMLLAPVCQTFIRCGAVPQAMQLKLAVNHYLVGMVCVLSEAVQSARRTGIPLARLASALNLGPMASPVMQTKLQQFVQNDFAAQAAIDDVMHVAELVLAQAERAGAPSPLMQQCHEHLVRAHARGFGQLDMAAVLNHPPALASTAVLKPGTP